MRHLISGLAFKYLSDDKFASVRDWYLSVRKKSYPLMRAIYGTFDADDLRRHLEERVGTDHEILMVHVSFNHLLPMYSGDPLPLVRMLMDFCGDSRTLAMPAFFFGDPKIGSVAETFSINPQFDLRRTPSQMGLATELFRRSRGVLQSRHPVYRVSAYGPLARELVRGHELAATPSGRGTPFDFMAEHNTRIIGLGTTIEVLTQVHHAEAIMGDDFPVPRSAGEGMEVLLKDGDVEIRVKLKQNGPAWRRDMTKLRQIMQDGSLHEWKFHHVPMFAVSARDVTDSLIEAAGRGVTLYERPRQ